MAYFASDYGFSIAGQLPAAESRAAFHRYSADVNDLLSFQGFRLAVEDELRDATVAARFNGLTWDRVEAALSIRHQRRMRGED